MNMETKTCPVCGTQTVEAVCPVCGFLLAERFAGEKSRALWEQNAAQLKASLLRRMQDICIQRHVFTLAGRRAACILPESGTLIMAGSRGVSQPEKGVRQYCASERNGVRLYANGTVEITGDNEYQQCSMPKLEGIRSVAVAANCVYGVTEEGRVCSKGTVAKDLKMSGVRALSCGYYHIAVLLESGKVLLDPPVRLHRDEGVKMAAAEGRETLLLYQDGHVDVCPGGNRETKEWKDIAAAAMDTAYVVGLSREGSVLLARRGNGAASDLLDMGRKDAAGWRGIIAVSCCRSGIGAVDLEGRLHLAGNIPDRESIQKHWDSEIAGPLRDELIRLAAVQPK